MEVTIKITVNGKDVTVETERNEVMSEVLKEEAITNPFGKQIVVFGEDTSNRIMDYDNDNVNMFLRVTERYATDMLRARGHVYLNEVFDMLGLPRTKLGSILGWVYREENPIGHNRVDFGLYEIWNLGFFSGIDNAVLSFNVDGIILDYIE